MRYNDASSSSLLEVPSQPSPLINLIPPPALAATSSYSLESGAFYPPTSHIFPSLDVRPRLSSSGTSSPGMAHAHRSTGLPHPHQTSQISTRDQYTPSTPSFRRASEHQPRSPSFSGPGIRRHPLSPAPSPISSYTLPARMDAQYGSKGPGPNSPHPPLGSIVTIGTLQYADGTFVKPEIHGTIDKGFFLADSEWTCYRRNYFSCVCSYSLTPYYPNSVLQYVQPGSSQACTVMGFAMCISAVVTDSDGHTIDLVQHTPKRDKGPIQKPEKVRLSPKTSHHPMLYGGHDSGLTAASRGLYGTDGYGSAGSQGPYQTEHTFERIQFKQATANNGKRRAAQQYYNLILELWADLGSHHSDQFVRVAYKKSAKMIVRGRSPGHYQTERRGSASSGPGAGSGTSTFTAQMMGSGDAFSSGSIMGGGYGTGLDGRGNFYGGGRGAQLPSDPVLSDDETKGILNPDDYRYYPATIYEDRQDPRSDRVEMYGHHQRAQDGGAGNSLVSHLGPARTYDHMDNKVKSEFEPGPLPPPSGAGPVLYHAGPSVGPSGRCAQSQYEGKPGSSGWYPTIVPLTGTHIGNIH